MIEPMGHSLGVHGNSGRRLRDVGGHWVQSIASLSIAVLGIFVFFLPGLIAGSTSAEAQGTNNQPEFPTEEADRQIAENTLSGVNLGDPIAATDLDADARLTYSIKGRDAANFAFNTATGQLTTQGALNHEARSAYFVRIGVSDGKNGSGNADIEVDDEVAV